MNQAPVLRRLELPADSASPARAREAVREVLGQCRRPEWLDAAELAVSELVTNAVLHAHTTLHVSISCGLELRVEVADLSPAWPVRRTYGTEASTGRGMGLVAAVTSDHGITRLEHGGKAVWFVLTTSFRDEDVGDFGDWSDVVAELEQPPGTGLLSVALQGLPSTLWLAAEERHDALLRELALLRGADEAQTAELAAAGGARARLAAAVERALEVAHVQGNARDPLPAHHPGRLQAVPRAVDVELGLSLEDGAAFGALQDVLDDAERRAAAGRMLTHSGLPEVIALRDWACEQVISQLNGQEPSAWPGTDAERFIEQPRDEYWAIDWDTSQIADSHEGLIAADDSNRIIAISAPLARSLGWNPQELVGRRVVAIVPPRFREAHVAGFTRHLTTGQAHAIGTDLELPVLKKDGSELRFVFFIEAFRTPSGRHVYVSRLTAPTDA